MLQIDITKADGSTQQVTTEKQSLMIGRVDSNDLCLEGKGISRYHARLSLEGTEAVIEDLGSTNGTYVNGEKVTRQALAESDKISIGPVILQVAVIEEDATEKVDTTAKAEEIPEVKLARGVETAGAVLPRTARESASPESNAAGQTKPEDAGASDRQLSKDEDFYWQSLSKFFRPVWHFIEDDSVSEVMINGASEIFIERKGKLQRADAEFGVDQLRAAVLNVAQYMGRRVSEDEPYMDARLPDGSRVAILMPPCSRKGISVSIRKFSREKLTMEKLIEFGSLSPEMVVFLRAAVGLRKNIIVSGGTSSGKTSLLNVLSGLIPEDERILTIEDSAELQLHQPHLVPMETKAPDKKGRGAVTIRDLVKASLRMRPDRIVVGEIRGGEAIDLLQAMNTGHSGSMSTVHASSPLQALNRLETLSLFSGLEIPMRALREQVASAIDLVIQAARLPDHSRKVTHISEVRELRDDGSYEVKDIFKFVRSRVAPDGKIEGAHQWAGNAPSYLEEMELAGFAEAVALFAH